MRRRDLLGLVGGGLVLPPFAFAAQQNIKPTPGRVPRIGFIAPGSQDTTQGLLDAFREALHALGSEEGSNPVIFERLAEGEAERLPGIAKQLIGSHVDALLPLAALPHWQRRARPLGFRLSSSLSPILSDSKSSTVSLDRVATRQDWLWIRSS
jgi:hypothetical protein